jgi:hypothetical protein
MSAEPDAPSQEVAGSAVVAALEDAWTAIRTHHPDVPQVVIILGAGSEARRGLFKWGHFAAARWHVAGTNRPEVLVSGEGLRRGAREVLATLMHEAAHGVANTRGIQDTSRQGRWHNRRFATLATELGLKVNQDRGTGWSQTHLTEQLADRYADQLTGLASALQLWRHAELQLGTPTTSRNLLACSCACGRKLRVAKTTLEQAPIICGACDEPFTPERQLTLNRQPNVEPGPEDPAQRSIAAEAAGRDLTLYCAADCDLNHAAVPHPPWDCNAPLDAPTIGEADRRVLAELDEARLPWVRYATPLLLSAGELDRLRGPILSAVYALEVDEHDQGAAEAERLSERLDAVGDRLTDAQLDAERASTVTEVPARLSCADANRLREVMGEAAIRLDDYARRRGAANPPYLLGTEHFTTTASALRDWCAATLARQQQRTTATRSLVFFGRAAWPGGQSPGSAVWLMACWRAQRSSPPQPFRSAFSTRMLRKTSSG